MDKFKNLFTDEEILEDDVNEPIEIKEVKKEEEVHKLPTFMRERLETEKKEINFSDDLKFNNDDIVSAFDVKKELKLDPIVLDDNSKKVDSFSIHEEKKSFKFPLEFSDDDFIETRSRHRMHAQNLEKENVDSKDSKELKSKHEILKNEKNKKESTKVAELYKEKKQESKKFKATPIISPIYGVLNKNYNSDEVSCAHGENLEEKRHSKSVDFDSVRKKAYGNLSKELKENLMCENCEYLKEAKECKKKEKEVEDNLVYDALNNEDNEYDYYSNITLDEATENYYDHGVEYEKTLRSNKNIDTDDIVINNHDDDVVGNFGNNSIPPVKSSINLLSTLNKDKEEDKNLELTDDLFNLIDSMYDERNDY